MDLSLTDLFNFNPEFFSKVDFSTIDKSIRYYAESIYGIFYEPNCYNIGYLGMNTPFLKSNDDLRKRITL
jgi:hypothetical protein